MEFDSGAGAQSFGGSGKRGKFYFMLAFFAAMTCLCLAMPFFPDSVSDAGPFDVIPAAAFAAIGVALFGGFGCLIFLHIRRLGNVYTLDSGGIRCTPGERTVAWNEVDRLDLTHPLGGAAELKCVLRDRDGRALMTLHFEPLGRDGRPLMNALQHWLAPLFEREAVEYLEGRKHWGMPLIKDVMKIEGALIMIEFPKGKKQAVPLRDIRRVEWFPGPISGAKKGFVLIEHPLGSIELPQLIRGMQYFLFALKNTLELGDRVNPELAQPAAAKRDLQNRRGLAARAWVTTGAIMAAFSFYYFVKDLPDAMTNRNAALLGDAVDAKVVEKQDHRTLLIAYQHPAKTEQKIRVHARDDIYNQLKPGDTLAIKVDPISDDHVYFKGKFGIAPDDFFTFAGTFVGFFALGLICLAVGLVKQRRSNKLLSEIEGEPGPLAAKGAPKPFSALDIPIPGASRPAAGPGVIRGLPPLQLSEEGSPPQQGPRRLCAKCNVEFPGHYYLTQGQTWCAKCRSANSAPDKPGFLMMLRAFAVGLIFAAIAAGVWSAIVIISGYELGIIAIVVGLIVGYGVKLGAGRFQGRRVQLLAVMLTFYSLSCAMIPIVASVAMKDDSIKQKWRELMDRIDEKNSSPSAADEKTMEKFRQAMEEAEARDAEDETTSTTVAAAGEEEAQNLSAATSETASVGGAIARSQTVPIDLPEEGDEAPPAAGSVIGAIAVLFALLVLALTIGPILIYIVLLFTSPMSVLFLLIALYEAWKINKVEARDFQGPYGLEEALQFDRAVR